MTQANRAVASNSADEYMIKNGARFRKCYARRNKLEETNTTDQPFASDERDLRMRMRNRKDIGDHDEHIFPAIETHPPVEIE